MNGKEQKLRNSSPSYVLHPLYSLSQVRALETSLLAASGAGMALISRAAQAIFDRLRYRYKALHHYTVFVGIGNNGADGLLVALLAHQAGLSVKVIDVAQAPRKGDALVAFTQVQDAGLEIESFTTDCEVSQGLVLDAMLGIGARHPLDEKLQAAVDVVNAAKSNGCTVVSVDIPTGLDVDSGFAENVVMADATISLLALKQGLYLGSGPAVTGKVILEKLLAAEWPPVDVFWAVPEEIEKNVPLRAQDSHKGSFAHITVIGGDYGYGGAVIMAAEAAAKAGAGMVRLFTREAHVGAALVRMPSIMSQGVEGTNDLSLLLIQSDVLVVGPGLGRQPWGEVLFKQAVSSKVPMIIDADGLYWLAQGKYQLPAGCVLTPHIGEAARLLNTSIEAVKKSPVDAVKVIAKRYNCVCLLKGISTLVAAPDNATVITGLPESGLAKGGSGDVLTGFVANCLGVSDSAFEAAILAVAWHNRSAARAALQMGRLRLQPLDVLDFL